MSNRSKFRLMSEEEYLQFEETASVRHEFVKGYVFAMSGSTDAHNLICGNILAYMHARLRGSKCRAYISDMKVRVESARSYYYPDVVVTCEPFSAKSTFKCNPVILVEVLSPSTAQIDRREKLVAYQSIPSLQEYVIVYQDRQRVELYRRESHEQWELMTLGLEDELVLESFPQRALHLPFGIIYEGYNPPSRVKEDEGCYEWN